MDNASKTLELSKRKTIQKHNATHHLTIVMIPSYISRQTAVLAHIQARKRIFMHGSDQYTRFMHLEVLNTPGKARGVRTECEHVPARCLHRVTFTEDESMLKLLGITRADLRVTAFCCNRDAEAVLGRNMLKV